MTTTNNLEAAHQRAELEVLKKELGIHENNSLIVGDQTYQVVLSSLTSLSQTDQHPGKVTYGFLLSSGKETLSANSANSKGELKKLLLEALEKLAPAKVEATRAIVTGEVIDGSPAITIEEPKAEAPASEPVSSLAKNSVPVINKQDQETKPSTGLNTPPAKRPSRAKK